MKKVKVETIIMVMLLFLVGLILWIIVLMCKLQDTYQTNIRNKTLAIDSLKIDNFNLKSNINYHKAGDLNNSLEFLFNKNTGYDIFINFYDGEIKVKANNDKVINEYSTVNKNETILLRTYDLNKKIMQ